MAGCCMCDLDATDLVHPQPCIPTCLYHLVTKNMTLEIVFKNAMPTFTSPLPQQRLEELVDQCTPGELGTCMVSIARMGDTPTSSLLDKAAAAMRANLAAYDPKVCGCVWLWHRLHFLFLLFIHWQLIQLQLGMVGIL